MKTRAVLYLCVASIFSLVTSGVAGQQARVNVSSLLAAAEEQYTQSRYAQVEKLCDQAVSDLRAVERLDQDQRGQMALAYELRARARFGKDTSDLDGVRKDFVSLLETEPSYVLGIRTRDLGAVNPVVLSEFSKVKAETVGTVRLQVTPTGAEVRIDDNPVDVGTQPVEIALVARSHTLSVKEPGYRDVTTTFKVTAGSVITLPINLDRLSSTFMITTEPADVQVFVDGKLKGTTRAGISGEVSEVLRIEDIASGDRELEFRKDCRVTVPLRRSVPKPDDIVIPLVKLAPAVASVRIEGTGGIVYVDGEPRGPVPLVTDICAGEPLVEVRTDHSRFVYRQSLKAGDSRTIYSELRPAVAILSSLGVPEGTQGDIRIEVEKALRAATGVTIFAPPLASADKEMKQLNLEKGWLAFDAMNKPIANYQSGTIPAPKRKEYSETLASRLEVQGVAEVIVPSRLDPRNVLLTLLAAGSGDPEVIPIDLNDDDSIRSAVTKLSGQPRLLDLSAGVQTADVRDIAGTVVVRSLWVEKDKPYLMAGEVIVAADGRPIENSAALAALLSTKKADDLVTLAAKGPGGTDRRVEVRLVAIPRVIGRLDETLLKNKLLLTFRLTQREARTADEEASARLNLAVALMKFGNWSEAKAELDKVTLPDRLGVVGNGTVKYLLGECLDQLNRPAEADDAFRAARESKDALLTADGPPIRELADAKLNDPRRKR